jgi:hypothetical protein
MCELIYRLISSKYVDCMCCKVPWHYLLTPCSRVLEKLTGFAASQEIPCNYGTRKFITIPTSACHLSLSSAPLQALALQLTIRRIHYMFKSSTHSISFISSHAWIRWLGTSADINQCKATIYTAFIQHISTFPNTKYKKLSKNRVNMLTPITSIYTRHIYSTGYNIRPPVLTTRWQSVNISK